MEKNNPLFPQGILAPHEYFTGTAWVNQLVPASTINNYAVGSVIFEPGARNHWHTHPAGQILLVTEGEGFYQERGLAARPLRKGDVVVIPAETEHWHGASKSSSFSHIVITNSIEGVAVIWLDPVTESEYNSVHA